MYFLQQTVPGLTEMLWFVPSLIVARPWTIVTYMFLHGNLMHIGLNMLSLYFFGTRVESRMGPQRFVALYFISGISRGLLSFPFSPNTVILSASCPLFGFILPYSLFFPPDHILISAVFPF